MLDDKLDILGIHASLVHVAVLLDSLELGDVVVIIVATTDTGALEVGHARTSAAREVLRSGKLGLRVHVLDLASWRSGHHGYVGGWGNTHLGLAEDDVAVAVGRLVHVGGRDHEQNLEPPSSSTPCRALLCQSHNARSLASGG